MSRSGEESSLPRPLSTEADVNNASEIAYFDAQYFSYNLRFCMSSFQRQAETWIAQRASIGTCCLPSGGIAVDAKVEFDIAPNIFFQIITHPENHRIVRSVDRCVDRRVLKVDPPGKAIVVVANRSRWDVGPFHGHVVSHLGVYQDSEKMVMMFTNAPGYRNHKLKELFGRWTIESRDGGTRCLAEFHQRIVPRGLPGFLMPTFARVTGRQVRHTFEDFAAEILRIEAGCPVLSYVDEDFSDEEDCDADDDPTTILNALEEASMSSDSDLSCFGTSGSEASSSPSTYSSGMNSREIEESSHEEPASYPLRAWSSLSRLHSIEWHWEDQLHVRNHSRTWDVLLWAWYWLMSELYHVISIIISFIARLL